MEQNKTKRRVGRPAGSGVINDDLPLTRVAEILLDQPEMRPSTAMREVLRDMPCKSEASDRTILRRWQGRWRVGSERYAEKAKAKRQATVAARRSATGGSCRGFATDRMLKDLNKFHAAFNSFRKAEEMAKQMFSFQNATMSYLDSPIFRAMQEPEYMQRIREQQERYEQMFPRGLGF